MVRTPNETVPKQFRLTQETLDQLDRIAVHYGVTRSDAIRIAARQVVDSLPPPPPKKKSRNPKKGG
jgi:metal-responsive CopG/Arc/MetJ family transcriptional regulator